jgi:DMSO/TMAO reductase YedYZ molybdopterin-dependent catalytic subunit
VGAPPPTPHPPAPVTSVPSSDGRRAPGTVAGAAAAAVALAAGELLAAVFPATPSPLDAVGALVVSVVPGSVSQWAIGTLGAANRPALTLGTVAVVALIGAALGVRGRAGFPAATVTFAAAGLLGLLTSLAQPGAPFPLVLLVMVGAVAAGLSTLWWLTGLVDTTLATPGTALVGPGSPTDPAVSRRSVLRIAAATGVTAVAVGTSVRLLTGSRGVGLAPPEIDLPPAARPLPPLRAGEDLAARIDGVSPALTPTSDFFRIDTALTIPRVDPERWRLRIHGRVEQEVELTIDDLLALPMEEHDATIACVSNEVGGGLIGTARWLGVPLSRVLALASPTATAEQLVGRSVDGWTAGFPLELLDDGRRAMVAVGMNGTALPARHGFPARLVVPGLFGYVSATKWLSEIELTGWDDYDAYWIPRGWSKLGPVKTGSRIDRPRSGGEVVAGEVVAAGVAWAPTRGVEQVEVQLDDGAWTTAELVPGRSADTWVQWHVTLPVASGPHTLSVRATDGDGRLQSEGPRPPAPDGAEGWHQVRFTAG